MFLIIYSYLLSISVAIIWIENNYLNYLDRDNTVLFKRNTINNVQFIYFTFLLFISLLPISWFVFLSISGIFLYPIYCSSNDTNHKVTTSNLEEDILNQQSNNNDQSFVYRTSNALDLASSQLNKDQYISKFKSNVQSNINKQLHPSFFTNDNEFKNKQQNVNIQVFNSKIIYNEVILIQVLLNIMRILILG